MYSCAAGWSLAWRWEVTQREGSESTDLTHWSASPLPHPGQWDDRGLTVKETKGGQGPPLHECVCMGVPQPQTVVGTQVVQVSGTSNPGGVFCKPH